MLGKLVHSRDNWQDDVVHSIDQHRQEGGRSRSLSNRTQIKTRQHTTRQHIEQK